MKPISKSMVSNVSYSISEESGLSQLSKNDINIFSPGVSTCGIAEIRMVKDNTHRKIIATTIDKDGFEKTKQIIEDCELDKQIDIRLEDLRKKLPYDDGHFDFIYARLVLHYLSDQELENVMKEFYRILKKNGKIFIVVRSVDDWEANLEGSSYDQRTGMTTYPVFDSNMKKTQKLARRRFHSKESITKNLYNIRFSILHVKEYKEQIYHDYMRTIKTPKLTSVIEVLAENKRREKL